MLNDADNVETINITNLSDIARAYKISAQDLVMDSNGITTPVENFEYSAKRMIRFVPRQFVLKPGERQTVRIMSRVPSDQADGEYHTHIRFLEDVAKRAENNPNAGQGAAIAAPLAYEALIPAVISHGDVNADLSITDADIAKNGNKYRVDLTLSRSGNGQGTAYIDYNLMTPDGRVVSATPRRTVYIYRELDSRTKDVEFDLPQGVSPQSKLRLTLRNSQEPNAPKLQEIDINLP